MMRWMAQQMIRFGRRHWTRLLAGALLSAGLLIGGVALWAFHDLPDVATIEAGMTLPATRIYDRNGTLLYEIVPPEQGRNRALRLDEIPPHCVNAVIATEDANYHSHPGIDPEGILRAAWINLRGGDIIAGGSTITQQTARLLLLDPQQQAERTIRRKLREMALAVQLQNRSGKEHVLTLYLNQVYFGNLAYGLEGAARAYFHKSATELSLAECALLAGMVQNPLVHDPLSNLESAQSRQQIVLLEHEADAAPAQVRHRGVVVVADGLHVEKIALSNIATELRRLSSINRTETRCAESSRAGGQSVRGRYGQSNCCRRSRSGPRFP